MPAEDTYSSSVMNVNPPRTRVLVVDDDLQIRRSLETALTLDGFDVATAADGDDALRVLVDWDADLLILDLMMGGRDGLSVCRSLRAAGDPVPILMLTARDGLQDRVIGLDAGADDYLSKPFALEELTARVRALARRLPATGASTHERIHLDTASRSVVLDGATIQLTALETALLACLTVNAGQVVPRSVLSEALWGGTVAPRSNSLEVYVSSLRSKLEGTGGPRMILTVRGVGYRFVG